MKFSRLLIRQFRNIESQSISLNPGLNLFRGQNGQGKTNLVEALYLLTHGRSFRTSRWDDFVSKNVILSRAKDLPLALEPCAN